MRQTKRIALDPIFPAPELIPGSNKKIPVCETLNDIKYHLVFDEAVDDPQLKAVVGQFSKMNPPIVEMDEEQEGDSEDSEDGDTKEDQ